MQQPKLGRERPNELLLERIGDLWAVLWARNDPQRDWNTLGSERLLDVEPAETCSQDSPTPTGETARPCRSTSGNFMLYDKAPIMWRSKMPVQKPKTTALSMAEAQYYAASMAGTLSLSY